MRWSVAISSSVRGDHIPLIIRQESTQERRSRVASFEERIVEWTTVNCDLRFATPIIEATLARIFSFYARLFRITQIQCALRQENGFEAHIGQRRFLQRFQHRGATDGIEWAIEEDHVEHGAAG